MNFEQIQCAIEHILNESNCPNCNKLYEIANIYVIATTKQEGLFEIKCEHCNSSTIVSVLVGPELEIKKKEPALTSEASAKGATIPRFHKGISQNDVLDIKNFLNKFDGNFKKIFNKKK